MATRRQMKSVEFKHAAVAANSASVVAEATAAALPPGHSTVVMQVAAASTTIVAAGTRSTANAASPVAAAAAKGAPHAPRFTAEETILLRGLASGSSPKEMAAQMRLPREFLYRLIGDLRRKTGVSNDSALAVWVLRNMGAGGRGGR